MTRQFFAPTLTLPPFNGDPQIAGVLDDGTPDGAVRAKLVSGELVRIPIGPGEYFAEVGGSATVTWQQTAFENPDGSMALAFISVPADPTHANGSGARLWYPFRGRQFGVRFHRARATAVPDFALVIDGEAHYAPAHFTNTRLYAEQVDAGITSEGTIFVDDLAEGDHVAEIVIPAHPLLTYQLTLFGFLVERRAGYAERPRQSYYLAPFFVPNAVAAIYASANATFTALHGARQLIYHNTDAAAAHVVTIYNGATQTAANEIRKIYLDKAGASQADTYVWDFSAAPLSFSALYLWEHVADAASAVNCTLIGAA